MDYTDYTIHGHFEHDLLLGLPYYYDYKRLYLNIIGL